MPRTTRSKAKAKKKAEEADTKKKKKSSKKEPAKAKSKKAPSKAKKKEPSKAKKKPASKKKTGSSSSGGSKKRGLDAVAKRKAEPSSKKPKPSTPPKAKKAAATEPPAAKKSSDPSSGSKKRPAKKSPPPATADPPKKEEAPAKKPDPTPPKPPAKKKKVEEEPPAKEDEEEEISGAEDGSGKMDIDKPSGAREEDDGFDWDSVLAPNQFLRTEKIDKAKGKNCPFLDQINRKVLDFDFEKVCSVTMTNHNVYCCLVCGSYFAGRAKGSPAYFHALHENHRVFIHLGNSRIYCLPEGYEVYEKSLNDIKHNLHPKFTQEEISAVDTMTDYSHALDGNDYLPGVVGLNNLSGTDSINTIFQGLVRIRPLRNFFIDPNNYKGNSSPLINAFGELVRKYFNPRNFKAHVSPHELLQVISILSEKQFQSGVVTDPFNFCAWFVNKLHEELSEGKKDKETIITKIFQGRVRVEIKTPLGTGAGGEELYELKTKNKPFLWLSMPLPPIPLFKDGQQEKFIPQVPLPDLFQRQFGSDQDDVPWQPMKNGSFKRHILTRLPRYLILVFKRYHENNFFIEKNNTIVNFVIKNLDLRQFTERRISTEYLSTMSVSKLKATLRKFGGDPAGFVDKIALINAIGDKSEERKVRGRYDLLANVCHMGRFLKGESHVYCLNRPNNQWYKMHDLHIQEILPNLVSVSEAYIQFWERRDSHLMKLNKKQVKNSAKQQG